MKHKYVLIYPYKFVDSLYTIYCLDSFSDKTEVLVLDISRIYNKFFSDSIAAPSTLHNVKKVETLHQLVAELRKIRKYSCDREICVNYIAPVISFISLFINLICFFYLKNSGVKILTTMNSGMPIFKKGKKKGKLARLLSAREERWQSLGQFFKNVYLSARSRFPSPMSYLVTHKLVAGRNYEVMKVKKNIKVIKGHSFNYDRYLSSRDQVAHVKSLVDTIVFIDTPGPFFSSDHVCTGDKSHKTIGVWYPALCRFFDRIESIYDAKVVISAHYLSDVSILPDMFGGRKVFSGCTNKLVAESKLVITEESSASAFAVIYKKPIIYIYSDEIKNDLVGMWFSDNMSKLLSQPKININQIDSIPPKLPHIDEIVYQDYINRFLTSAPDDLTNAQLIESEVLSTF